MRKSRLLSAVVSFAAACSLLAAFASNAGALSTGSMEIEGAGLCISNLGATGGNAPVELETCNGSAHQTWYFDAEPLGGYLIHNSQLNGGCIAHPSNSAGAGLTVQSCSSGPDPTQEFTTDYAVANVNNGAFGLNADNSSYGQTSLCVSNNGQLTVGSRVLLETCHRADPNQTILGVVAVVGG